MRNLQRWSVILVFVVGIFGCIQKSTSFKPNSEPDGFSGIKWGTEILGSQIRYGGIEKR